MADLFDRLAEEVRFVRDRYSEQRKREIVEGTVEMYRKFGVEVPSLLKRLINDYEYKMELAHDRSFCEIAGIDYVHIDREWDNLRAGAARHYMKELWVNLKRGKRVAA